MIFNYIMDTMSASELLKWNDMFNPTEQIKKELEFYCVSVIKSQKFKNGKIINSSHPKIIQANDFNSAVFSVLEDMFTNSKKEYDILGVICTKRYDDSECKFYNKLAIQILLTKKIAQVCEQKGV